MVKKTSCTGKGAKKPGVAKKPGRNNPRFRLYRKFKINYFLSPKKPYLVPFLGFLPQTPMNGSK